jgi:acyl carrier protein
MEKKAIDLEVENIVVDAIRALGCDASEILPEHRVGEDLGIDSSEIVELAMILRGRLGEKARALSLNGAATVFEVMQRVQVFHGSTQ